MPHNDHWRLQRKVMHSAVGSQALKPCKAFQEGEGKILMCELLDSPVDFALHFEKYAYSLVSILRYSRRVASKDDVTIYCQDDGITIIQVPGSYWLEAIPELQYLPSWIYSLPSRLKRRSKAVARYWWGLVLKGNQALEPNFAKTLVKSKEEQGLTELDIAEMVANLIGGGMDTTASTLHTLVLDLRVFPDAQLKAHEELDRVIGHDRSRTWDDLDQLSYRAAVLKEAMRWRSVTTMGGFAHTPTQEDEYRGYRFHAGIPIFSNFWGIHRNLKDFPGPDIFLPDRYLPSEYT
ncbi:cytochrome P450 [Rhexocercosporidium sp. MPI-PUGE-AT-0058]|nr:cytochrome P450 [Rhexocercosporidium sp. MPI-PUGE-AT-0058]